MRLFQDAPEKNRLRQIRHPPCRHRRFVRRRHLFSIESSAEALAAAFDNASASV